MKDEAFVMGQDHDAGAQANALSLEIIETEASRLAAQVRKMAAANRALSAANDTLTNANTTLRRDTAEAQATTQSALTGNEALRVTNEALQTTNEAVEDINEALQTTNEELQTANETVESANEELQATNEIMDARNADLEATIAEVERVNAELKAHRVALQELAAVLEAERAQLAAILAGVEDAVLVVNQTGTIVRANAAYVRLFGDQGTAVAMDDARGVPLAPDLTPRARAARAETFSLSFSVAPAIRGMMGEHTRRWFVATGQSLQEGGATHGVVVIRDVTVADRHRRLQDEFLMLAAHELRTPLTSIQGYLELLAPLLSPTSDERAHRYALRAVRQTGRLVALVRDLTDAARLQGDKLRLAALPLDMVQLVEDVVEMARTLPPEQAIRLTADAAPLWVLGDAGRLEQVLLNLLTNAAMHAPSKRAIDVRVRATEAEIELQVQDYGRGIAADQLPHIFARFYQIARPNRPSQGGLGLGLYLCQELSAAHGGRIDVVSRVGVGTTFTVRLPLLHQDMVESDIDQCRD